MTVIALFFASLFFLPVIGPLLVLIPLIPLGLLTCFIVGLFSRPRP